MTPKTSLMIGPTGVGKTDIARRLAKLANAPSSRWKRPVHRGGLWAGSDSIIRDLTDIAIKLVRETEMEKMKYRRGGRRGAHPRRPAAEPAQQLGQEEKTTPNTRQIFRKETAGRSAG